MLHDYPYIHKESLQKMPSHKLVSLTQIEERGRKSHDVSLQARMFDTVLRVSAARCYRCIRDREVKQFAGQWARFFHQ